MEGNKMASEIAIASELLMTFIQAWMLYQKKQGLNDAEISEAFKTTFGRFMVASANPVDPVKK